MDDSRIIELFFKRDEQAIEETTAKYGNYCYSIARNILDDDEDRKECLNDTYLAAWNAIPPHHPVNFAVYLGRIVRNISLKKVRENNALKRGGGAANACFEELEECISDGRDIRKSIQADFLAEILNDYLSEMKESERDVFVCRYWYFDSVEQIARRFGCSESKVKMICLRNREKLKVYLEKEGITV